MKFRIAKYFFGLIVASYVITIIGIPVYFHYCGGELEEVSYIVKGSACCGDDEPKDDGCCKDEGVILKSSPDFTPAKVQKLQPTAPAQILFFPNIFTTLSAPLQNDSFAAAVIVPPPKLQEHILSVTVLRI